MAAYLDHGILASTERITGKVTFGGNCNCTECVEHIFLVISLKSCNITSEHLLYRYTSVEMWKTHGKRYTNTTPFYRTGTPMDCGIHLGILVCLFGLVWLVFLFLFF